MGKTTLPSVLKHFSINSLANNATIDIHDLHAGIYFLRLETGKVLKILKK
ncbi:MAG: T9SS type A sorting domain-containing protein [Winogradskyella sp.]|nr:MAG: T9SS type A sorting domain-containing protein [Winogradskyella sp.]